MENNVKLHDRIEAMLSCLNYGLYEKETAVRLGLLTVVAGGSMFFLGEPGCAKSMVVRRIKEAFKPEGNGEIKYFETLLNEFSTPDDVYGPVSLKALNAEGENGKEEYKRITTNMLPEADVAFLDEIWKASVAIQTTLLHIVNERIYHNGNERMKVPLKGLFAASNELPAKNAGLEALYDRFIMRLAVEGISKDEDFLEMVQQSSKVEISEDVKQYQISKDEWEEWSKRIDDIPLSSSACEVIKAIRKELANRNESLAEDQRYLVSDRRWKKIVRLLRTSAFLNDRDEVDLMDCQLIEYCIWSTDAQREQVRAIVEQCIQQNGIDCDSAIGDIEKQIVEYEKEVDSRWFNKIEQPAEEIIVEVDGEKCFQCTRNGTNETWYVGVDKIGYYSSAHRIYKSNKEHYGDYAFGKNEHNIKCAFEFTVQCKPVVFKMELKGFSDILHKTYQENFDRDHYTPIVEVIAKEKGALQELKRVETAPFKANLFADQECYTAITSKIDDAIKQLEDAKISLDKQRCRYYKKDLAPKLKVGDVIFSSDLVLEQDEAGNLNGDFKSSAVAVAVVCAVNGDKTYAVGVKQERMSWNETAEYASSYGKKNGLPEKVSEGWMIPGKEVLNDIYLNKDVINKSFENLGEGFEKIDTDNYWSSTKKGKETAHCQNFGDGKQDHTSLDHEYAVCVVREWKNV